MTEVYERMIGSGEPPLFTGVAIGLVTNAKDPDGMGRVKLKLPWLADGVETDWARVAAPAAGAAQYGVHFMPRVDDEALVAFEHGDPASPFVVGWLWNGRDKPPDTNADGKAKTQTIRSRTGHVVRLDDSEGAEKVEILCKGEKNSIVIDLKSNTVTVTGEQDVVISATKGKLSLKGKTGVEIVSEGSLSMKASSTAELKGGSSLTLKGQTVNIN